MKTALVIVDVQAGMFDIPGYPELKPHDGEGLLARIADLIARARAAGVPRFFVQHDGGPGDPLAQGGPGFAYHPAVAPRDGEDVTVKRRGSAFNGTELDAKLRAAGIARLVICGMQSEYCIDAAVRGAVERGYRVVLAADGHSTYDSAVLKAAQIIAHENQTLGGSYAEIMTSREIAFAP